MHRDKEVRQARQAVGWTTRGNWLNLGLVVGLTALSLFAGWYVVPASLRLDQATDYRHYYEPVARNIAAGNGIVLDGVLATKYPPVHPLLLSAVFLLAKYLPVSETVLLAGFTFVCAAVAACFLFLVSRELWGNPLSFIPVVLWLTYPLGLYVYVLGLDGYPLSEISFIAVLFPMVWLLWRTLRQEHRNFGLYVGVGVLAGLAMLIRSIAIGIPIVLILLLAPFRGAVCMTKAAYILTGFALLAGAVLVVLPWEVTMYRETGGIIPLSHVGRSNFVDGLTSFAITTKSYRQTVSVPIEVEALMNRLLSRREEMDSSLFDTVLVLADELRRNPVAMLELFVIKSARSWYASDSGRYESIMLALQIPYLVAAGLGGIFAWHRKPKHKHFSPLFWSLHSISGG